MIDTIFDIGTQMEYPGRFLIVQHSEDTALLIYGVTARSEASKAKRYVHDTASHTVVVVPTDADIMALGDLSLLDYTAVRIFDSGCVVGNGRQVDCIVQTNASSAAMQLEQDLLSQTYEHDAYATPRITACTVFGEDGISIALHRIRKWSSDEPLRECFDMTHMEYAHFISTYAGPNVRPTPSSTGTPIMVTLLPHDLTKSVDMVYRAFAPHTGAEDLRVSVVGCLYQKNGSYTVSIINSADVH